MTRSQSTVERTTSISDLPHELLIIIFQHVYRSWRYKDIRSLTLFPYALAYVCSTWHDVMSSFPHFWTQIVIYADDPFPPPAFLSLDLKSSQDSLIELTVTRKKHEPFKQDPDGERQRMKEIMDIIIPHIPRCKALSIDVTHSSSLPRILTDFPNSAPHLTKLSLKVLVPGPFNGLLDNPSIVPQFQFPILEELEIDGWNFVDLHRNADWWTEKLSQSDHLFSLGVSLYRPTPGVHGEDPFEFISAIPLVSNVNILALDDLEDSFFDDFDFSEHEVQVETLRLSHLSRALMPNLICMGADYLTIDRCPLNDVRTVPRESFDELHLQNISFFDTSEALQEMLECWDGQLLSIKNCRGFDDAVLFKLGLPPYIYAPHFTRLVVKDCDGFSMDALKEMVDKRTAFFEKYTPEKKMAITVWMGPPMNMHQRQWFIDTFGVWSLQAWSYRH